MLCTNCGEGISGHANFCPVCGADLRTESQGNEKKFHKEYAKKAVKAAAGAAAAAGSAAAINMGKQALNKPTEKVKKKAEKKIEKVLGDLSHEILVAAKLEKRTPLEKIQKAWKKRKK